jgi:hypothetical protein
MYLAVLFAHSIVRWVVLGCAVWASLSAQSGMRAGRAWTRRARIPGVVLAAAVDVQFLLGISLWLFLSPHAITQGARSHYWTFAHPLPPGMRRSPGGSGTRSTPRSTRWPVATGRGR